MWDLPRSGIEPVSSALAGGFFTTKPPGKPWCHIFLDQFFQYFSGVDDYHNQICQPAFCLYCCWKIKCVIFELIYTVHFILYYSVIYFVWWNVFLVNKMFCSCICLFWHFRCPLKREVMELNHPQSLEDLEPPWKLVLLDYQMLGRWILAFSHFPFVNILVLWYKGKLWR